MKSLPRCILKPGREKSVRNRHPWIFSGAVKQIDGSPGVGDSVAVCSAQGEFLARATYHPGSQIIGRIYSYQVSEELDLELMQRRLLAALERRKNIAKDGSTSMYRVVCHEADHLPGLIIDRYGDYVSFQILSAGMEKRRDLVIRGIEEVLAPKGIIERSEEKIRQKEQLKLRKEWVKGALPEGERIQCLEDHRTYEIDLWNGHKTGFYLDQRDNRTILQSLVKDRRVLNNFCYTGGFSVAAAVGGAKEVISVDTSQDVLAIAEKNVNHHRDHAASHQFVKADVFQLLREMTERQEQFDLIVLDPPKFASSQKTIQTACRGYKDLNRLAFKLLKPGGLLLTFSCSGLIPLDLFQKVVFSASQEADCEAVITHYLTQSLDHPILLSFPESFYLKGFVCEKR